MTFPVARGRAIKSGGAELGAAPDYSPIPPATMRVFFFQRMITKLKIQQRQWPLIPVQERSDTPALLPRRLFGMLAPGRDAASCCSMGSLDPFPPPLGVQPHGCPWASPSTSSPGGTPAPTRAGFSC